MIQAHEKHGRLGCELQLKRDLTRFEFLISQWNSSIMTIYTSTVMPIF